MPSYTPITLPSTGIYTSEIEQDGIVDSIYGDLGGSYGFAGWVYGGFANPYTPTTGPRSGTYTPIASATGAFTPATLPVTGGYVPA